MLTSGFSNASCNYVTSYYALSDFCTRDQVSADQPVCIYGRVLEEEDSAIGVSLSQYVLNPTVAGDGASCDEVGGKEGVET